MKDRVKKLEVGKAYKYQELCKLLGQNLAKGGSEKRSQVNNWERYFKWTNPMNDKTRKPSKKFLITEIYDEPLEKQDGRVNNGKEWIFKGGELDNSIMAIIKEDGVIIESIDCDYIELFYKIEDFITYTGLATEFRQQMLDQPNKAREMYGDSAFNYSIMNTRKELKEQVFKSLDSLKARGIIDSYCYGYAIHDYDSQTDSRVKMRVATDEESQIIAEQEQLTVDWWNAERLPLVNKEQVNKGLNKYKTLEKYSDIHKIRSYINEFFKHCYELCREKLLDYSSHSRKLCIKVNKDVYHYRLVDMIKDNVDYRIIVNNIYGEGRLRNTVNYTDKMKEEIDKITHRRGGGTIQRLITQKYPQLTSNYTVDDYTTDCVRLRGLSYIENYVKSDSLTDEERKTLQSQIDYAYFEADTRLANSNLVSDLIGLDILKASSFLSDYTVNEESYVKEEIKLQKDCTVEVVESTVEGLEVGEYTYKDLVILLDVPCKSKITAITEYRYDKANCGGKVLCKLQATESITNDEGKKLEASKNVTIEVPCVDKVRDFMRHLCYAYDSTGSIMSQKQVTDRTYKTPHQVNRKFWLNTVKDTEREKNVAQLLSGDHNQVESEE